MFENIIKLKGIIAVIEESLETSVYPDECELKAIKETIELVVEELQEGE